VAQAPEFAWVARLLDRASYDERTGRALHVALAELGQLAGWVAYDAGHHGLAQRYYLAALRAAHSADDRPLGAHILGCMAYQATHQEQPAEAVTLIDTALTGVRGRETPRLLAALYIKQAYARATLRDASACTAAIELAESLDSTRSVGRIRDLHEQLTPHAEAPAVRDFLERARGFLAA